jgi:NAD+ kinase
LEEAEVRVLLVPNTSKSETAQAVRTATAWLSDNAHEPVLLRDDAEACGLPELGLDVAEIGADVVVALGGDGTIIKSVHVLEGSDPPVLGVNFGRLGFLSGADAEDLLHALEVVTKGGARVESRMTLSASVVGEDSETVTRRAVNEVFVGRIGASRVVDLAVLVNGEETVAYTCDGLIVASPTGSTAYALSAGGPVVSPEVRGLVLVPVAPHTLADRAIVFGPEDRIEIVCPTGRAREVCVTVDGQDVSCTTAVNRVEVCRSERDLRLLRLDGRDFLRVVGAKFLGA